MSTPPTHANTQRTARYPAGGKGGTEETPRAAATALAVAVDAGSPSDSPSDSLRGETLQRDADADEDIDAEASGPRSEDKARAEYPDGAPTSASPSPPLHYDRYDPSFVPSSASPSSPYGDEDRYAYPPPTPSTPLVAPPNFRPFFTLVKDAGTGEYVHPLVYYVFADDDPMLVTAASVRSLGVDETVYESPQEGHTAPQESPLPAAIPGVEERYLIVDIGVDGRSVERAQSLGRGWQVTGAEVRNAASFAEGEGEGGEGFMLCVEGVGVPGASPGRRAKENGPEAVFDAARERCRGDVFKAMDGLMEGIEAGLRVAGTISGVVVEGEREEEGGGREGEERVDTLSGGGER